jgi:hypothetical protein
LTGWQPYSVKIGDTWYAYNRLDPVGATLGLGADISEIIGSSDDADALDMASAAVVAVAKNVSSKTYLAGIMNFITAFDRAKADPSKENLSFKNYMEKTASSFVPLSSFSAAIERQVDPTLRSAQGVVERIKSRTAGYSADLPPTLNLFGEPVVLEGGIGPDIMSPIYTSTIKKDPVTDELSRINIGITMPSKVVGGVRLDTQEYHDYVLLAGKNTKIQGKSYKAFLKQKMSTQTYKRQSDESKRQYVQTITQGFREKAQLELLKNNSSLSIRVKQSQAKEREALRPNQ